MASADELRRLAFIRYLFRVGLVQSRQPMPLAAASLLTFHDAVELFLVLACEHLNCPVKENMSFAAYFESLRRQPGISVSGEGVMVRLNKARVNLKHYGNLPAKESVEGFRESVSAFLDDNCSSLFEVQLQSVSMTALVEDREGRSRLEQAEARLAAGEPAEAIKNVALAYRSLIRNFGPGWDVFWGFHMENVGRLGTPPLTGSPRLNAILSGVGDALDYLWTRLGVLEMGFDIPRYQRFTRIAPGVHVTLDGREEPINIIKTPAADDVQFCIEFVVDCALTLQSRYRVTTPPVEGAVSGRPPATTVTGESESGEVK
ncbi:MAG: hypothetical protein IMZ71_04185 [Chloroflexi bacterium]|nr:hypothetical protein [Chloroflexota bacterium]